MATNARTKFAVGPATPMSMRCSVVRGERAWIFLQRFYPALPALSSDRFSPVSVSPVILT